MVIYADVLVAVNYFVSYALLCSCSATEQIVIDQYIALQRTDSRGKISVGDIQSSASGLAVICRSALEFKASQRMCRQVHRLHITVDDINVLQVFHRHP